MTRSKSAMTFVLAIICLVNFGLLYRTHRQSFDKVTHLTYAFKKDYSALEISEMSKDVTDLDLPTLQNLYRTVKRQLDAQKLVISLLSQPAINNHNFSYIHNPTKTCASKETEVLFVVPSASDNFENRAKVRNSSRARYVENSKGKAKMLFFLGKPSVNEFKLQVQLKINDESFKYRDIVQDGFEDTYRNIRLKAVSMLKWVSTFCEHAKYVIRTDDDVSVNPQKLVAALERKHAMLKDFIMGNRAEKWGPIRVTENKYFLSENEYPNSTLPTFVLGGLMGYPTSTVKLLYQAALRIKPLWLDDVFITGICAARLNVSLVDDPDFVFKHWAW